MGATRWSGKLGYGFGPVTGGALGQHLTHGNDCALGDKVEVVLY